MTDEPKITQTQTTVYIVEGVLPYVDRGQTRIDLATVANQAMNKADVNYGKASKEDRKLYPSNVPEPVSSFYVQRNINSEGLADLVLIVSAYQVVDNGIGNLAAGKFQDGVLEGLAEALEEYQEGSSISVRVIYKSPIMDGEIVPEDYKLFSMLHLLQEGKTNSNTG